MDKLRTGKSKPRHHYDWLIAPQMYLASASFIARKLCPHGGLFENELMGGNICKEIKFRSSHPNYEFIWPIVFNLKHGIELWLKALGNIDHGEYYISHDLKKLFELLKKDSGNNRSIISKLHRDTWPIIEKYYYGTYNPTKKDKRNPDKQNEAERFPEAKSGAGPGQKTYKIKNHYKWFKCDIVSMIIRDIDEIQKNFAQAERDIRPRKRFRYSQPAHRKRKTP